MNYDAYKERLNISIDGDDSFCFFTKACLMIAQGYTRVVIGGRGPYIEFDELNIIHGNIFVPRKEQWRHNSEIAFYEEFRSNCKYYVKVYFQKKFVDYADYRINMYYISPFDLYDADGKCLIEPLKKQFSYINEIL